MYNQYQAGDILVACDNRNGLPPGYMGHSAIVVDPSNLVEAVMEYPNIRKDTIEQLIRQHPLHAWFRPVSEEMGQKAAACALDYVRQYRRLQKQGLHQPVFSFSSAPLDDPWNTIYCSKLVWLCYHYGAGHTFSNDFDLFSPEDLFQNLKSSSDFQLQWIHPAFRFYVDL